MDRARQSRWPALNSAGRRISNITSAGRIHVVMEDGSETEAGPGESTSLPLGHDAWVVGDEPGVTIDWHGASVWGRPL